MKSSSPPNLDLGYFLESTEREPSKGRGAGGRKIMESQK